MFDRDEPVQGSASASQRRAERTTARGASEGGPQGSEMPGRKTRRPASKTAPKADESGLRKADEHRPRSMGSTEACRLRLEEMIRLVQLYRGWTQKQVAEALERNVHALVPDSGNPKLDLVVKLSAILTNKADEVAERLGHWALRERLFGIEHLHRVAAATSGLAAPEWNFDDSDVRTLMGVMGRFPKSRAMGWRILGSVREERREGSS